MRTSANEYHAAFADAAPLPPNAGATHSPDATMPRVALPANAGRRDWLAEALQAQGPDAGLA